MMPGMGLTSIGLAGLTLSYAGIAHTFIDGMHALTGLTMFVGLIFLAAGILDGGISTSNKAKATTLVILSIALGFGMYAMTMNSSNYTVTIAGVLMAIAFPAIITAYLAMKHPIYLKPVGTIVCIAGATGIIVWVAFGFVSPDTYMIPQVVIDTPEDIVTVAVVAEPDGPIFDIAILEGSDTPGNPDYEPDVATVPYGHTVVWSNMDVVAHTVTSSIDFGETFDSSLMNVGGTFFVNTSELEPGEHEYYCLVHPTMRSTLIVEAPLVADQVVTTEEKVAAGI